MKTFDKTTAKKWLCLLLTAVTMAGACGCNGGKESASSDSVSAPESVADSSVTETPEEGKPNYTLESYNFTTIFTDGATKTLRRYNPDVPAENGKVVYDVYSNLGNRNYLKLNLSTDVDLVGYINYYNNLSGSKSLTVDNIYEQYGSKDEAHKTIALYKAQKYLAGIAPVKTVTTSEQ